MTEYAYVTPRPAGLPSGSDRLVSTRIGGVTVALPCYEWCTTDHHSQDHRFVEDVSHSSEPAEVRLAPGVRVFAAEMSSYPHCSATASLVVDTSGDSIELTTTEAEAFADDLITTAARIRLMARTLGGAQ